MLRVGNIIIQSARPFASNGSLGSFERIDHEGDHIEIRTSHPDSEDTVSHWLRFQKEVEIIDEDGESKSCRIAVAYSLDKNDSKNKNLKKNSPPWKITPLDHGQVSIFFPAEKETSNLKFHLHAPFASTVARDSVRDCESNRQLRDCLAELVAESLIDIRDKGMLTMEFLAVLPIQADNLSPFYEPVRETIVRAFNEESLTLTRDGSYAPATELYRGPKKIDDVLNAEGLSLLTNGEPRLWAANPPQQNQRDDRFLDSLELDSWGWEELSWALNNLDEDEQEVFELWIVQKDDAWMRGFYALLGEVSDIHEEYVEMENFRIVRIESDQGDEHVLPEEAFFPPEDGTDLPEDISFVKPSVYMTKAKKKYAYSFLEEIGVRAFDEKAMIELRLGAYASHESRPDSRGVEHYQDVKNFIAYWKKNPADVGMFKRHNFLLASLADEQLYWCTSERLCVDDPYLETGLAELNDIHGKNAIWEGYKEKLVESVLMDFIVFLKAIEVMHDLKIESAGVFSNPHSDKLSIDYSRRWTHTKINQDYSIDDIDQYLSVGSVSVARLIWIALTSADRKVATARFRPNQEYPIRQTDSQLVCHLKEYAWVPDKLGGFRKPQDMTKDDLPSDFPYDDRNGLLTAIGFGEQARKHSEEYNRKNHHAQNMGFESADEAEIGLKFIEIMKESGKSPEEFLAELKPTSDLQPSFPSKPVATPERRQERLGEQLSDAPEKEDEKRERSVRTTRGTVDPASRLKNQYTNESGQMVCQICEKEHFRKRDGEHYFEAVEALSRDFFPKEHESQFLALCPLCAAMYKEFVKKDEDAMADLKMELSDADDCVVPLKLGEQKTSIRFFEDHFMDLKVILEDL